MDAATKSDGEFNRSAWNLNFTMSLPVRPYAVGGGRAPPNFTTSFHHQAYIDRIRSFNNKGCATPKRSRSPIFPQLSYLPRKPPPGLPPPYSNFFPKTVRKSPVGEKEISQIVVVKTQLDTGDGECHSNATVPLRDIPEELLNLTNPKNLPKIRDEDIKSCPAMGDASYSYLKKGSTEKKEIQPAVDLEQQKMTVTKVSFEKMKPHEAVDQKLEVVKKMNEVGCLNAEETNNEVESTQIEYSELQRTVMKEIIDSERERPRSFKEYKQIHETIVEEKTNLIEITAKKAQIENDKNYKTENFEDKIIEKKEDCSLNSHKQLEKILERKLVESWKNRIEESSKLHKIVTEEKTTVKKMDWPINNFERKKSILEKKFSGKENCCHQRKEEKSDGFQRNATLGEIKTRFEPVLENVVAYNENAGTNSFRTKKNVSSKVSDRVRVLEQFGKLNRNAKKDSFEHDQLVKKVQSYFSGSSMEKIDSGETESAGTITKYSQVPPMDGNNPDKTNTRAHLNSCLIDSIKAKIMTETKDISESDSFSSTELNTIKFPKETQAAMKMFTSKRCDIIEPSYESTPRENCRVYVQETGRNEKKNQKQHQKRQQLKQQQPHQHHQQQQFHHQVRRCCVHLPCHKNLLCKKGLHVGRCSSIIVEEDEEKKFKQSSRELPSGGQVRFLVSNEERRQRLSGDSGGNLDLLKISPKMRKSKA